MLSVALTPERTGGVFVFFCFCSGRGEGSEKAYL